MNATLLWELIQVRYPPLKHAVYSVVWMFAVRSALQLGAGHPGPVPLSWHSLVGAVTLLLLFFFMRVVDEVRDLEYDRVQHPERILARGAVSVRQARAVLAVTGLLILAANAAISAWAMAVLSAVMLHSVLLIAFERASPWFARSLFLNTGAAILLKVGATYYVCLLYEVESGSSPTGAGYACALSLVAGYLHWEVSRKIVRPRFSSPGEKLYSNEAGVAGAFAVAFALLAVSVVGLVRMATASDARVWPGVVILAATPSIAGLVRFVLARDRRFTMGHLALASYIALLFTTSALVFSAPADIMSSGEEPHVQEAQEAASAVFLQ